MKLLNLMLALFLALFSAVTFAQAIDLNTASAAELEKGLKGIGSVRAAAIVEYRETHGPFKSIDDLAQVPGIKEKTLEKLLADNQDKLTVGSVAAPETPVAPTIPATPAVPAKPAMPTIPATPAVPVKPAMPTIPATPAIPVKPAMPTVPAVPATPALPAAAQVIDLNTASAAELEKGLKGIGPVKAAAIVEYREAHGPFKSVNDLTQVPGIKDKALEKLLADNQSKLTVGNAGLPKQ